MQTRPAILSSVLVWRRALFYAMALECLEVGAATSGTSALPLSCPPSVPISATPPKAASPGWKVYIDSELYLNSAAPISGPPEMHGDLAEFTSRTGKKEWSYTYNLDREFSDGKWLECGYGTHDEVTLSQRMPDTIKECVFTYRKGEKAGQNDIKINCH